MIIYRVTYPLVTADYSKDFVTRTEAEQFAAERRDLCSRSSFFTRHDWLRVKIEEVHTLAGGAIC